VAAVCAAVLTHGTATASPDEPPVAAVAAAAPESTDATARERHAKDLSSGSRGAGVSAQARARADDHSQRNAFLTDVLRGRPHSVTREGPWTTLAGEPLGIVREITFDRPVNVPMRAWPAIRYDERASVDAYTQHSYEVEVHGMTSLTLFIDSSRGVVGAHADAKADERPSARNERLDVVSDH
jgi:hypothetical protein